MSSIKSVAEDALASLIVLVVSGMPAAELEAKIAEAYGTDLVGDIMAEIRRRITLAANYNRDELLGEAIVRAQDLYKTARAAGDVKSALQAHDRIAKLTRLYELPAPTPAADATDNPELAAIRAHLIPLGLAPEDYPLREHARIAADRIRAERSSK